jgi:tripartite-type tricarboxylate transporter receptor subunit TctC
MQAGRIHALAVTTLNRSKLVPDLPTVSEAGLKGFEANNWYGIVVPAKTPKPIVERLNKEFVAVLNMPDIREILFKQGLDAAPSSPDAFGAYIRSETAKWAKVIKASGAKPE